MTNVEIYGTVKHVERSEYLFIEVKRGYKNSQGKIESDLIPCKYWTKSVKNVFMSLFDDTKILLKGRLECNDEKLYVVVEEFKIL